MSEFVEYPKMVYRVEEPSQKIVMNKDEEAAALTDGWQLAETFFSDEPKIVDEHKGKKKGK